MSLENIREPCISIYFAVKLKGREGGREANLKFDERLFGNHGSVDGLRFASIRIRIAR